ncbi:growth-regulated alpha protein-like [Sphaeramia orbicularis]|uniref:growth-regulated alpha protein-like n=1 Tax=Sphaeramia orbicularis TaxID=375764 RepID=UPI00117C630A|nr:growth-regulated alpha protein-like [Sphaeramia orbicularis]
MNAVIRAVILLACAAICTSRITDGHCRCVKTTGSVNPKLIRTVKSYDPRPYCNKKEVIVTLKDKTEQCLDPDGEFTQAVLATVKMQRELHVARKKSTTTPRTTTGSTGMTGTTTSTPPTTT